LLQRIQQAALSVFAERGDTHISVSALAAAAGVARGTIYTHVPDPDGLFEEIAGQLSAEMQERVTRSFDGIEDPAHRLAQGIRHFVRRAHEDAPWGRFLSRFGFNNRSLQHLWMGQATKDLMAGIASGRYLITPEQLPTVVAAVTGATLAAISLVLEGHRTWRDAGSETAELMLVALGIGRTEARRLATLELPALPDIA
jgi:AcrR family transcriptional regulator